MKKLWKIWSLLAFIASVLFILYHLINQNPCSYYYNIEKKRNYSGIIINKYIDNEQHNYKVLRILSKDSIFDEIMNTDKSGLFEYLILRDSIVKYPNDYKVDVFRNQKYDTTFIMDFKCIK